MTDDNSYPLSMAPEVVLLSRIADQLRVPRPQFSETESYWVFYELHVAVDAELVSEAVRNEDRQDELMTNLYYDVIASEYFKFYTRN